VTPKTTASASPSTASHGFSWDVISTQTVTPYSSSPIYASIPATTEGSVTTTRISIPTPVPTGFDRNGVVTPTAAPTPSPHGVGGSSGASGRGSGNSFESSGTPLWVWLLLVILALLFLPVLILTKRCKNNQASSLESTADSPAEPALSVPSTAEESEPLFSRSTVEESEEEAVTSR